MLIEVGGARILTDPILSGRVAHLRRHGGAVDAAALGRLDAVLISHAHLDHLHAASLRRLAAVGGSPTLVVPPGAARHVRRLGFDRVEELEVGGRTEVAGVAIAATPASHDGRRHPLGRSGEAVGYLVGAPGSQTYFAGDTDLFPELESLAPDVDVALLPVWGWGPSLGPGHLDPASAAEAVRRLAPSLAVPIHWGTLFPLGLDRLRGRRGLLSDPPLEFARQAAKVAPNVEVRVLGQGQAVALPAGR